MPADVEHFVLMQTAFRSLEDQAEAQKGKLDAPPVLQQKRSGPRAVMPKGELPFTVPRPAAMKPGVALYLDGAHTAVAPKGLSWVL